MDFYEAFSQSRANKEFKLKEIAEFLEKDYDAVRMAVKRKTLTALEKRTIADQFNIKSNIKEQEPNAITVNFDEMRVMYVPLVNQYAYAGFLNGFGDHEYLESLPKLPWADDKEHRGDYLCFEVKGDSMDNGTDEAYKEGDILLCRRVRQEYWKSRLHINQWDFVIVHKEDGILLKRIVKHEVAEGILTLHSLNDYYEDKIIKLSEVQMIFNVVDFKRSKKRR